MLSTYLNKLKTEHNVTNQEWSNLSGIPKGTIDRLLSRESTSCNLDTAAALVKALGGSLDEAMGIEHPLRLVPEDIPDDTSEIISHVSHLVDKVQRMHHAVHREKDAVAADAMRFRTRALICSIAVNLAFVLLFVFDFFHPEIGWIQYDTLMDLRNGLAASWSVCSANLRL